MLHTLTRFLEKVIGKEERSSILSHTSHLIMIMLPSAPEEEEEDEVGRSSCMCSMSVLQSWIHVLKKDRRLGASFVQLVTSNTLKPVQKIIHCHTVQKIHQFN